MKGHRARRYRPGRFRLRKPRPRLRHVVRERLPGGIFRWEIHLICDVGIADDCEAIHRLLKASAAGRWKLVWRRNWDARPIIERILLERDSDAVLLKLHNVDPIFKVFRIVLPDEAIRP